MNSSPAETLAGTSLGMPAVICVDVLTPPSLCHAAPKYSFDTDLRNPTFNMMCYQSNFYHVMQAELTWSGNADSGAASRTHTKRKLWSKAMADNINLVAWPSGTWQTNCPNAASTAAGCTAGTPCRALCTVLASHGNSCGGPPYPPPSSPAPAPSGGKPAPAPSGGKPAPAPAPSGGGKRL